jgi:hypothetical protein
MRRNTRKASKALMRPRLPLTMTYLPVALLMGFALSASAQTPGGNSIPRTPDGKPDLHGIWQVLTTAEWNLEPHEGRPGVPAGLGVVEGETIPYQPAALATRKQNFTRRAENDPIAKCYLPGVPRATYMPFPFEIFQTPTHVAVLYEYAHTMRVIPLDGSPHADGLDFWMGDSRGHYEGDTLVVDVTNFNDATWFDRAGNFHSDALHVVERYTRTDADTIQYEATIEDPKVFTKPWKISMPLYRHKEKNFQLLEYECYSFVDGEPFGK